MGIMIYKQLLPLCLISFVPIQMPHFNQIGLFAFIKHDEILQSTCISASCSFFAAIIILFPQIFCIWILP